MEDAAFTISVVIFCYNRTEYIERAITSVMFQDFEKNRYEVLIIKNFPDREEWNSEIPKVRQFNKDGTIGDYIQVAYKESMGEIICFLDDDDWFAPNKLKEVSRYFTENDIGYLHDTPILVSPEIETTRSSLQCDIYVNATSLNRKNLYILLSFYADDMMSRISVRREILRDVNEKLVTHTASNYTNILRYSENSLLSRHLKWNLLAFSVNLKFIDTVYKIQGSVMVEPISYSNTLKQLIRSLILTSGVILQRVLPAIFYRLFNHEMLNRIGFI